jgi:hypothetical protein
MHHLRVDIHILGWGVGLTGGTYTPDHGVPEGRLIDDASGNGRS